MSRILAFTDESGNTGLDFNKQDVSSHFIVTAIIVEEEFAQEIFHQAEQIRKKYFQTGEMKSSSIGKSHRRRTAILSELLKLNIKFFAVVIDKRKIFDNSGLRYKQPFYKFINNIMHEELRNTFKFLTVCADEVGTNEYMRSFSEYVKENSTPLNLFGDRDFYFENSTNHIMIQVADIISGTLSFVFEENKRSDDQPKYLEILDKLILKIEYWPKDIDNYIFEENAVNKEYDHQIAELSFKQAQQFLHVNKNSEDEDVLNQIIVLKYLCFRFVNNQKRKYISTKELKNQLKYKNIKEISTHYFRTKIIAKLRDANVLISSSPKGYKIPANEAELYDFINHGTSVIMPMLNRLKRCRDTVKAATLNKVDLFDHTEYTTLKKFFEDVSIDDYKKDENN